MVSMATTPTVNKTRRQSNCPYGNKKELTVGEEVGVRDGRVLAVDGLEFGDGFVEAGVAAVREFFFEADGTAAVAAGLGHLVVGARGVPREADHRGAEVPILRHEFLDVRAEGREGSLGGGRGGTRGARAFLCLGERGCVAHDERRGERGEERVAAGERDLISVLGSANNRSGLFGIGGRAGACHGLGAAVGGDGTLGGGHEARGLGRDGGEHVSLGARARDRGAGGSDKKRNLDIGFHVSE